MARTWGSSPGGVGGVDHGPTNTPASTNARANPGNRASWRSHRGILARNPDDGDISRAKVSLVARSMQAERARKEVIKIRYLGRVLKIARRRRGDEFTGFTGFGLN